MALPNQLRANLGALTTAVIERLTFQKQSWAAARPAEAARVKTAVPATAALHIQAFTNQPDVSRTLSLTFVDSAVAAAGSIIVATLPTIGTAATGTVVVGAIAGTDKFKIRKSTSDPLTTWTFGTDFSTAADLNTLINGLDYVNSTLDTATITVTASATNTSGNDIVMTQTGGHFTITPMANGADGDFLGIDGKSYEFIVHGGTPVGDQIALGTTAANTATAIAAQLTTDKTALGLASATVSSSTHVDMVVDPAGVAGNSKVLAVDGTRITKVQFVDGQDAGGMYGTVVITGTDILDAALVETVTVDTTTALTYVTKKAFKSVTDILCALNSCETGNTMAVGGGPALGLDHAAATVMMEVFNGVLGVPGSLDVKNKTYIPAGTLNSAKACDIVTLVAK